MGDIEWVALAGLVAKIGCKMELGGCVYGGGGGEEEEQRRKRENVREVAWRKKKGSGGGHAQDY